MQLAPENYLQNITSIEIEWGGVVRHNRKVQTGKTGITGCLLP
ncbi:hypothetical protein BMETH_2936_0 [methanotrophic bacterial endosymbiont of Bathymodiolus sp.]|nr:hypothetical protein BMETH_2936_0 [methanotrophic bacterial endosymbiont of Bathymodiolus sp.]